MKLAKQIAVRIFPLPDYPSTWHKDRWRGQVERASLIIEEKLEPMKYVMQKVYLFNIGMATKDEFNECCKKLGEVYDMFHEAE